MKKAFFTFIFIMFAVTSISQQRMQCGNGGIDTAAFSTIFLMKKNSERPLAVAHLVKVYFTVFADNDGSNATLTAVELQAEFTSLLNSYAARNICFINMGVANINNSTINNNFNADSDPNGTALAPYQVPGCINIFYMQKIGGNNTACNPPCGYGGIALGGIPGTYFLVARSNVASTNSIGHEMGHSLGLLHTFEKVFGIEKIDGSNSTTTGDRIQDTPADPYVYNGNACYAVSGCNYTGTCTDPNGASNYAPPYNNLMGYWSSNTCYTNPLASSQQFNMVEMVLDNFANLFPAISQCVAPVVETVSNTTISSGYYMKAGIDELNTAGIVVLDGTTEATLGAGKVRLLPGFRASPSANGAVIKITTKPCN